MSPPTTSAAAERDEVVSLARELGRRELEPLALALDLRLPGALGSAWERIGSVGFDRALLDVENGGVGLDVGSLLLCLEEIAVGDAGLALLVLLANAALTALPPERAAQVDVSERWVLVPVPGGPTAGAAGVALDADAAGEPALNGSLPLALGALGADGIVVAQRGADGGVFALRSDTTGTRLRPCEAQLGLRSAAAAGISLSAAPVEYALSAPRAELAVENSLALLQAGTAMIARGVARRAFELALEYARARVQGGVAIVEHDAVRRMLAAMSTRLAASAPMLPAPLEETTSLLAKVAATEAALATATDAVQVFGGTGYMHEAGVEKLMRDSKYLQLWPQPNWLADDRILAGESKAQGSR